MEVGQGKYYAQAWSKPNAHESITVRGDSPQEVIRLAKEYDDRFAWYDTTLLRVKLPGRVAGNVGAFRAYGWPG